MSLCLVVRSVLIRLFPLPTRGSVLSMPIGMEVLMVMDVLEREKLPFPRSLPEFQRYFPDEVACIAYLEKVRWLRPRAKIT